MAEIALKGNPIHTLADLPAIGSSTPDFTLTKMDLSEIFLSDFTGIKLVLNIFPSIDTSVCAASVRKFNAEAGSLDNTVVLCISKDLPFALKRFCGSEGLEDVISVSGFRNNNFGEGYGIQMIDGPLKGLYGRAVVVVGEDGKVTYTELVPEIGQEPNYEAALAAVK